MLDSHVWRCVANARRMLPASGEILLRSLRVHETAEMLSHHMAGLWCLRGSRPTACSKTSHCMKIPQSSRSEIVIGPSGFSAVHSCSQTSVFHW